MEKQIENVIIEIRGLVRNLYFIADGIENDLKNIGENECARSLRNCARKYQKLEKNLQNHIIKIESSGRK